MFFLKLLIDGIYWYVIPSKSSPYGFAVVPTQAEAVAKNGGMTGELGEDLQYFRRQMWFRLSLVHSGVYEESLDIPELVP